jgi:N utilization substance protein B
MGLRRKSRVIALQVLYEVDSVGHDMERALAPFLADGRLNGENAVFARHLASGVLANKADIDEHIKKFATAWPLEQIPLVDRNILRLAIFEILLDNSVPIKVAINEAVELAKLFGSNNSPKFVNGVLGSVSRLASRAKD